MMTPTIHNNNNKCYTCPAITSSSSSSSSARLLVSVTARTKRTRKRSLALTSVAAAAVIVVAVVVAVSSLSSTPCYYSVHALSPMMVPQPHEISTMISDLLGGGNIQHHQQQLMTVISNDLWTNVVLQKKDVLLLQQQQGVENLASTIGQPSDQSLVSTLSSLSSSSSSLSPEFTSDLPTVHHMDIESIPSSSSPSSSSLLSSSSSSLLSSSSSSSSSSLLTRYRTLLRTHPLPTKMTTGSLLSMVGDAIVQTTSIVRNQSSQEQANDRSSTSITDKNKNKSNKNNNNDVDAVEQQQDESLLSAIAMNYNWKRAGAFAAFDACWRAVQQYTYPPMYIACDGQFTQHLLQHLSSSSSSSVVLPPQQLLAAWEQTIVSQLILIPVLYYPVFYAVTSFVQNLTFDQTIERAKETFVPLMKRNLQFWIPVQFAVFGFVAEDLQIPILIVAGLAWTVILSVVAGNVKTTTTSTTTDDEEGIQTAVVEEEAVVIVDNDDDEYDGFGVEVAMMNADTVRFNTTTESNNLAPKAAVDEIDIEVDVSQVPSKLFGLGSGAVTTNVTNTDDTVVVDAKSAENTVGSRERR